MAKGSASPNYLAANNCKKRDGVSYLVLAHFEEIPIQHRKISILTWLDSAFAPILSGKPSRSLCVETQCSLTVKLVPSRRDAAAPNRFAAY
jgi:hypothetical protein